MFNLCEVGKWIGDGSAAIRSIKEEKLNKLESLKTWSWHVKSENVPSATCLQLLDGQRVKKLLRRTSKAKSYLF